MTRTTVAAAGADLSMAAGGREQPRVTVLTTGGTIAGAAAARSPGGYDAGKISGEQLIAAAPGIEKAAALTVEQVSNIGSQDMHDAVWFKLARRIDEIFAADAADGIVITHGTDTMEETAFFLEQTLACGRPVVLTGAMRPAAAIAADGPANLYQAVQVAACPAARGRGVLVVMHATIHAPRHVTKMNTTALNAFAAPNTGPLGFVEGQVLFFHPPAPVQCPRFRLPGQAPLPRVDIVYAHAGMGAEQIAAALAGGARGIVLAGVGNGNAAAAALDALAGASGRGVLVVRASRTPGGFTGRNIEADDDRRGFVAALDLNPAKARVLAQLLIANGITEPGRAQTAFEA